MRISGFLLLFFLLYVSCTTDKNHIQENLLVEVNGKYLYREELQRVMPSQLSPDDSLLFAESYIRNWVEDNLLYEKAETNIPDSEEIEKLVENYRKSLIVHTYQQALINERIFPEITEDKISEFYENNKNLFVTDRPLIKGLFLKIPLGAPQISDVRKWYKTETHEAVENLEKYSWQNAVSYDYFYDKWTVVSDVLGKIPLNVNNPETYLKINKNIEVKDTAYYYFLNITDFLDKGDPEPYEFAKISVKEMLLNTQKVDFIKELKNDLYQKAIRQNKVKYNY